MTATYDLIASNVLTSSASSVTFSSISGYRDLVVVADGRTVTGSSDNFVLRFNGDTGNNYNSVWAETYGTSNWSSSSSNSSWIILGQAYSLLQPTESGLAIASIMDYSATDKHKSVLSRAGRAGEGVTMLAGRWANTSAITSVTVLTTSANFAVGSSFYLYGIVA